MPQLNAKVPVVTQRLEGEIVSGEVLGFPEVSCCDHDLDEVRNQLVENVLHWLSDLENAELHRRWIPSNVTPFEVRVVLEPNRRPGLWREPLELVFPAVRWRQAEDAHVAFVPTLGIEVLVNKAEDLLKRAEDEVRATLLRTKATKSLRSMVELQRGHGIWLLLILCECHVYTHHGFKGEIREYALKSPESPTRKGRGKRDNGISASRAHEFREDLAAARLDVAVSAGWHR